MFIGLFVEPVKISPILAFLWLKNFFGFIQPKLVLWWKRKEKDLDSSGQILAKFWILTDKQRILDPQASNG